VTRVSVIVPVYEQWNLVPALLACLDRQTLPSEEFEIILVDNGSKSFGSESFVPPALPGNARIIQCARPGSYAARNAAADQASGEWLAFTDSDCLPEPGWLEALMAAAAAANGPTILVGAVDMRAAGPRPNAYEIYDILKGIPQQRYAARGYGATANLATSAGVFRDLGGFDAARLSGGDADFCRRAGARGTVVTFVESARVGHPARSTWLELKTKARRVKGGQVTIGSLRRRLWWGFRTITPPIIAWWRFAQAPQPAGYRLTAMAVQFRLWLVEIGEVVRLAAGGRAERS
jgi:glycosyltransferase involved in cell wall biosynthesis